MTDQQIINQSIDYAYKIGDKDEYFCKHVANTISAIYVGNGYKNIVNYIIDYLSEIDEEKEQLDSFWKQTEDVCKKIGADKFMKLVCKNKHYETTFLSSFLNLKDSFYIEEAQERKIITEEMISELEKIKQKFQKCFNQELLEDFQIIENEFRYNIENGNIERNKKILNELKLISIEVKPTVVNRLETDAVLNKFKSLVF